MPPPRAPRPRARRDTRRRAHLPRPGDAQPHPISNEEEQQLEVAFDQLPDDYRIVITLHRLIGLSHEGIAEAMDRKPQAVHVLLHRTLAKLAVLMDEKGA